MRLMKHVPLAAVVALMAMTMPSVAQQMKPERDDCATAQDCVDGSDQRRDNQRRMRDKDDDSRADRRARQRKEAEAGDNKRGRRFDDDDGDRRRQARSGWRYDSDKHRRRAQRDSRFRYEYGGYWYEQPYWTGTVYYDDDYGISCRQGRRIVDRRYNRVRVIECNGRTFTYVGRRQGDTYRVSVSSRTGRIIGERPI